MSELNDIKAGEISEILFRGFVVRACSVLFRFVNAQISLFVRYVDGCTPFLQSFVPTYASIATSISFRQRLVMYILRMRTKTKIVSSAIQSVAVRVVNFTAVITSDYYTMHVNPRTFGISTGVDFSIIERNMPQPLRQPLKVCGIDDGSISLRERNKSVGLVQWLNDFVTFLRWPSHKREGYYDVCV